MLEQFEGAAGGGMVKVTVSGQREVVEVNLDAVSSRSRRY